MTRVTVIVEEVNEGQADTLVLYIPIQEFTQGVQFGETSDAINYAQRCVSWIRRQQMRRRK